MVFYKFGNGLVTYRTIKGVTKKVKVISPYLKAQVFRI